MPSWRPLCTKPSSRSLLRQPAHTTRSHHNLTTDPFPSSRSIGVPTSRLIDERTSYPITPECPPPRCACAATPIGLEIDYKKPLQGTMPPYTKHVVINTGQNNWGSRIEEDSVGNGGANLAKDLKALIGPKGKYHDPYRNILITNSSLGTGSRTQRAGSDVLLFPEGCAVKEIGNTLESLESFVERFLMPTGSSPPGKGIVESHVTIRNLIPTILVCGHGSRDRRCGVLGPLLQDEFRAFNRRYISKFGISAPASVKTGHEYDTAQLSHIRSGSNVFGVRTALCSHIGGHVWAGNVIIYLPPEHCLEDGSHSPLAGKGIWYGRVEPKHVEGIIEETLRKGHLIEELLRGVHDGTAVKS